MNSEKNITEAPLSEPTPIYKKKKSFVILSILLAVLLLLNAALVVLLAIGNNDGQDTTASGKSFDYSTANIKDYLSSFSNALYTGKTFAGKEYAIDNVDDEYVTYYINSQLLGNATASNGERINKTQPIDYADKIYFYILSVKEVEADGVSLKDIDDALFINAYGQIGETQIGAELFGKEFDEALMGKAPNTLGSIALREHGYTNLSKEPVLIVSYEAKIDGEESAYKTVTGMRWNTAAAISGAFENALLAKLQEETLALGEGFKLDVTHDIDEDGKDETVHYTVCVNAAVTEEMPVEIIATLPDNYFGEKDDLYALNGKKLAFSVIVDHSIAYEISYSSVDDQGNAVMKTVEGFETLTAEYIKGTLGFTTDKTDDGEVRDAYFAETKKTVEESLDSTRKQYALNLIWQGLAEGIAFDSLPKSALDEAKQTTINSFLSTYSQNYYQYQSSFTAAYPTIEDYARAYFGYSADEYEDYETYIEENIAPISVKKQLLLYAIYNSGEIENTYEKYMELLNKTIDSVIENAASQDKTITRDEALENLSYQYVQAGYSADYLKNSIISQIVNDYLYEKNTVDWELSAESQD